LLAVKSGGAAIEVTNVTLAPADAAELAEMLQFLSDWLTRERHHLEAPMEGFVGNSAYDTPAAAR
jgi:hypothetical protein